MADTNSEVYGFTSSLGIDGIRYREVREAPFDLYGLYEPHTPGVFRRLPAAVAEACNPGVVNESTSTSGGRVRFCTDSDYVALHAVLPRVWCGDNGAPDGMAGFDLFVHTGASYRYYGTFRFQNASEYEAVLRFPDRRLREIIIHCPLYSSVEALHIGVQSGAALDHGRRYRIDRPFVSYGSSITQGGCASHPGNSYQAILSNALDCDFLNLGFSGSARGERAMADYIAGLDMSAFLLDYDHNAPTVEHLRETHEAFFSVIRAAHPTLPVLFISQPDTNCYAFGEAGRDTAARRDVILATYRRAVEAGDKNVSFIDGDSIFAGSQRDLCTVDGCHPNDAGFLRMADVIGNRLAPVLL